MTATPTDLAPIVAFIERRLREDEVVAMESMTVGEPWRAVTTDERGFVQGRRGNHAWAVAETDYSPHASHIARHDPARVLAQVAALRAVVAECDLYAFDSSHAGLVTDKILRHVAAIWRGAEGWREEWAS